MPDCKTLSGCLIPTPLPNVERVLKVRDCLVRLKELNIGSKILEIYNVGMYDLDLLLVAEEALTPEGENDNGPEMDAECEG